MGYIRDNDGYYASLGCHGKQVKINDEAEKRCGHDGGTCNPRKAKEFAETVEEVKREMEDKP